MAVPKRRTSKTKKRMRRTHYKIEANAMTKCTNCGEMIQPHRVCSACGFYKGKNVMESKEVEEAVETAKEKEEIKKPVKKPVKKAIKKPVKKTEQKVEKEETKAETK